MMRATLWALPAVLSFGETGKLNPKHGDPDLFDRQGSCPA
jgi:hypothetical protein